MDPTSEVHTERRFNVIDEPWVPVVDRGLVSLSNIFSLEPATYRGLGGNAVQKIAVLKLLLAIAQAACTPDNVQQWRSMGVNGLASQCMQYLDKWHDSFYLYGDKPFLQMPTIRAAKIQPFGAVLAEVASGNATVLSQFNVKRQCSDAEKAMLVLQSMGFGMGGKKTDNTVVLSAGYFYKTKDNGKETSGRYGPSLGFMGFLHSFLTGANILETIWANLFQMDQIQSMACYPEGIGTPPWEYMPSGESCEVAERLKSSLMGRLIPVSRFILLSKDGLHYSEGILHPNYMDGVVDPSVAVDYSASKPKILWADTDKKPWRSLTSLLSFMGKGGFECYQLKYNLPRLAGVLNNVGVWAGGLRVSSNAGEQYVSGSDDYVDSYVELNIQELSSIWYANLKNEMLQLSDLAQKTVYGRVSGYFKTQQMDASAIAAQASGLFWQLCEPLFQKLVAACDDEGKAMSMRPEFAKLVFETYDYYCPRETARQIDAWAKNRPSVQKYLHDQHGGKQK